MEISPATKKAVIYGSIGIGMLLLINRAGQVKDTINGLTFSFGVGGAPTFSGLNVTFPVLVNVRNSNDVQLPLSGLGMTLERLFINGTTTLLAATDPAGVPASNIAARAITSLVVPVTTSWLSVAGEIISAIKGGGIGRYRLRPSIVSAGVRVQLPDQILTF